MLPTQFQFIWLRGFSKLTSSVPWLVPRPIRLRQAIVSLGFQRHISVIQFEYRYLYLNKSYLSFNRGRRFFRNQPIRNKNWLWRQCLLTNRDKMSNFYRGPSIDASYQVSVHLAKWFQRRRFKKIGQSETIIACGGHVCYWIGTKWAIFIKDLP